MQSQEQPPQPDRNPEAGREISIFPSKHSLLTQATSSPLKCRAGMGVSVVLFPRSLTAVQR